MEMIYCDRYVLLDLLPTQLLFDRTAAHYAQTECSKMSAAPSPHENMPRESTKWIYGTVK